MSDTNYISEIMKSIISPHEAKQIQQPVIIDARAGGPDAYERYLNGHWENALYVDLEKDLSKKPGNAAFGGRHPLPDIYEFGKLLGKLGIKPSTHVLVYDDKGGANAAARFWWMLKSVGHEKIQVIDGGLDTLIKSGATMTSEIILPVSVEPYPGNEWKLPVVDIEVVEQSSKGTNDFKIVDVRESFRYRGESEPIDLVAGHIPGAVNVPFVENLQPDGKFKPAEELQARYNKISGGNPEKLIVHCGSGVTACHTLLAMDHAGITGAKLYVGSWSEWSRREKPVGKDQS